MACFDSEPRTNGLRKIGESLMRLVLEGKLKRGLLTKNKIKNSTRLVAWNCL